MTNLSGHATVLMVDDDADVLETTAHMLAARGFRVFTAPDQESAMQVCREQEGRIDALIADLSLPGDSRGDLARAISAVYPPHARDLHQRDPAACRPGPGARAAGCAVPREAGAAERPGRCPAEPPGRERERDGIGELVGRMIRLGHRAVSC